VDPASVAAASACAGLHLRPGDAGRAARLLLPSGATDGACCRRRRCGDRVHADHRRGERSDRPGR
jgi:hypothetical protein